MPQFNQFRAIGAAVPRVRLALVAVAATMVLIEPEARPAPLFPQNVLGASLFRSAWAYKHDRPWLESQLEWLSRHRFDAIRALGVVGDPAHPDFWDGREVDWRWSDYDEVIAGLTDLAFDKYKIRVQWTIFADAQKNTPREADRAALVERFIRMSRGRERKILAFEVANEFWQNGFNGADGVRQLERYSARLRAATSVPTAASSHRDDLCPLYKSDVVDFATVHFDRNAPHATWTPLVEPWRVARQAGQLASCALPPVASNNEPLGPGSSLPEPQTPTQVVMSAVNTYVAGIPVYVFHSGPGVRDDANHPQGLRPSRLDQLPGSAPLFNGLAAMRDYLPRDVWAWRSITAADPEFPFRVEARTAISLGAVKNDRFVVAISDARGARVTARKPLEVRVIDPLTGKTVQTRQAEPGESLPLSGEAAVLTGTMRPERKR